MSVTNVPAAGCRTIALEVKGDDRGSLIALESSIGIPFAIERVYYVFATKPGVSRGFHAHWKLRQWAVCLSGECTMLLDDGAARTHIKLDRPELALEIGPMVWHEMHDFSPGCVMLVLADAHFDESDYIRNYDAFLNAVEAHGA